MASERRGPGLIGTTARTAQDQAEAASPPPTEDDKFAKLQQLAELQKQGILTDEEFAAEKAKILGS